LPFPRRTGRIVGKDLEKVKLGGHEIGKPTVGHLGDGLHEIRSTIVAGKVDFRTLFRIAGNVLVLLHAFRKTTQKTRSTKSMSPMNVGEKRKGNNHDHYRASGLQRSWT